MRIGARLDAAAWLLMAALPLGMAIANRSATALILAAALVALAARWVDGETAFVAARLRTIARHPLTLVVLAFLALAGVSLAWSHHPARTIAMGGEVVLAALAPLLLHAALPRTVPPVVWRAAAILAGAGAIWILVEIATGSAVRAALGFRSESFIFKRSATAILIVLWPMAWHLSMGGARAAALALAGLVLAAMLWSHAAAATLGLVAGLVLLVLARSARAIAVWLLAAGLGAALLLAPVTGELASRALGERVLNGLQDMQARDRVLIWRSFGEVVRVRPLVGTGFGTSAVLHADPVAAEVPADRRTMLAVGHPHNGYLQVWTELGAVGVLLTGLALALLLRRTTRLEEAAMPPACAVIACAGAIMLVAHGAWQGWWITTLGAAAIWTTRLGTDQPSGAEPR